jgi:hypothetical protein
MKNKKAQGWGMDLVIVSIIFLVGIIIFYFYAINSSDESRGTTENLFYDGKIIAGTILTDGFPSNWNNQTVVKVGILSDHKINDTKLEMFYNMTKDSAGYNKTRLMFNTKYDYYFLLDENMLIAGNSVEGFGKPGTTKANLNPDNLIKITRFVIYKDKPITAYVYIWV